jgi:proteasome lid subunit RPN8/RPN11
MNSETLISAQGKDADGKPNFGPGVPNISAIQPSSDPQQITLNTQRLVKPFRFTSQPYEYQIVPLRDCPTPENMQLCDTPQGAADYWRLHVPQNPYFNRECECFTVLLLNTRRRVKEHQIVSLGTHDTILVHPMTVFRLAIMTAAAAVVLVHNHPSGDPTPSEADIKVTRDLIRAGQLLKIEVLDHVIIGTPKHTSLRELGYFYS